MPDDISSSDPNFSIPRFNCGHELNKLLNGDFNRAKIIRLYRECNVSPLDQTEACYTQARASNLGNAAFLQKLSATMGVFICGRMNMIRNPRIFMIGPFFVGMKQKREEEE